MIVVTINNNVIIISSSSSIIIIAISPNLPTKMIPTKILWLKSSGTIPYGREHSTPWNQDPAWVKPSEIQNISTKIGVCPGCGLDIYFQNLDLIH